MSETYAATLHGNRLEWRDLPPARSCAGQPVKVQVMIADEPVPSTDQESGAQMADILAQLAAIRALPDLTDPAGWERDLRQDRPLPGRES